MSHSAISNEVRSASGSGDSKPEPQATSWLGLVSEKVKTLDYGVVQIVVHGGQVVQVERTERHRFDVRSKG